MSDARLRALAREVALTGGFEARVRLLVLRARTGDLALSRLRLAAYLRDPAARRALAADVPRAPADVSRVLAGLSAYGVEACLRAAVAVGRAADPELVGEWRFGLRGLLDALSLWLDCPCGDHEREVRQTVRHAEGGHAVAPVLLWAAACLADEGTAVTALRSWRLLWDPQVPRQEEWSGHLYWDSTRRPHDFVLDDPDRVRRELRARLVPWALA